MQKPITLIYEDFKKDLGEMINSYNLPAFMVELILQSLLSEVTMLKIRQYEHDKEAYESSLSEIATQATGMDPKNEKSNV